MSEGGGPDWVRDGLRQFFDEVRLFAQTALDFTLRPSRFAQEWGSGERHALNPLGFLATAFAVVAPCERTGSTEIRSAFTVSGALLLASAILSFSLFYYTLSSALGGLHAVYRIRWWQILIANIVSMLGTGLMFGLLHPPGSYGLHFVISVGRGGHDWQFGIAG